MPTPRKAQAPANGSDRRDLENLLRSAAEFFQTNQPYPQFSRKKSPPALSAAAGR